jgi:aminopeptidase N
MPDQTLFDSTNYEKGGVVLHMLREEIGDMAFWSGVRLYLARHRFDNVSSEDLRKAMEEASRTNLQSFFSQWVHGKRIPQLQVYQSFNSQSLELTLSIEQKQNLKAGETEIFQFPLDLTIVSASGSQSERIEIRKRHEILRLKLPEAPTEIKIDPNDKIPLKSLQINRLKIKR